MVQFALSWIFIALLLVVDFKMYIKGDQTIEDRITSKPVVIRWSFYLGMLLLIGWFAMVNNAAFIYFQF